MSLNLIKKYIRKIWLREKYFLYVKKLSEKKNIEKIILFKEAKNEDLHAVAEQFKSHFGENAFEYLSGKINSDEILLIGYENLNSDKICFLSWLSEKEKALITFKKKRVCSKVIFSFRTLVPPEYRNMKVGRLGIIFAQEVALKKGYKEVWGIVKNDNIASQKMLESLGWYKDGNLLRKVFLRKEFFRVV
jgi:GNAT superfamily N-acetyltransferase